MKRTYIIFIVLVIGIEILMTKWATTVPQLEMEIIIVIAQLLLLLLTFNVLAKRK